MQQGNTPARRTRNGVTGIDSYQTPAAVARSSATPSAQVSDQALQIVRLAISAAHADGAMSDQERAAILDQARIAGVDEIVEQELAQPRPLAEIVAGVNDDTHARHALCACIRHPPRRRTADRRRTYLPGETRATCSGSTRSTVQQLEQNAAQRIDAEPEQLTSRPDPGCGSSEWAGLTDKTRRYDRRQESEAMSDDQWFMAIGGHQVGPVSQDDVVTNLRNGTIDGNTLVFSAGHDELDAAQGRAAARRALSSGGSRGPAGARRRRSCPGRRAHEIDFKIIGSEMQFVEVELDPGESAVAEAGSMMYMTPGITMETVFGDGSAAAAGGVMGALLGAGKRLLTGESLFMTVFTNQGQRQAAGGVRGAVPGKILAMDLKQLGGQLICQKDSFLCAARGVSIGIAFQRQASASACSAVKASSCRSSKATASASCTPAARCIRSISGRADAARRHRLPRRAAADR